MKAMGKAGVAALALLLAIDVLAQPPRSEHAIRREVPVDVRETIQQLGDEDPARRAEAARRLGQSTMCPHAASAVPRLIEMLGDREPYYEPSGYGPPHRLYPSFEAARALAAMGKPAVAPLVRALGDESAHVRHHAAFALSWSRAAGPEAVPALALVVNDESSKARGCALRALGRTKDPRALETITPLTTDEDASIRADAVGALRGWRDRRALNALIAALADADRHVRWGAARALGEARDAKAVPALLSHLADPDRSMRIESARALGETGGAGVAERLAEFLDAEDVRFTVHVAAAAWKAGRAPRALKALLACLGSGNSYAAEEAAKALAETRASQAIESLTAAIRDSRNGRSARRAVARSLASVGPRATAPLIELLKDHDWRTRACAAHGLEEAPDPRAVEPLITALKDPQPQVRVEAARALGSTKDPRAVGPLLAVVEHDEGNPAWLAAQAVADIGEPGVKGLIALVKHDEAAVRRRAVVGLSRARGPAAIACLAAALDDPDPKVRLSAFRSLTWVDYRGFRDHVPHWDRWWNENRDLVLGDS